VKEIRSGIRHALALPLLYDAFQVAVGAYAWRKRALQQYVFSAIPQNGKLIDIGCGTAEILKYLPTGIEYIGFDRNPAYIEQAKANYAGSPNASFFCEELSPDFPLEGRPADVVLALGLVHHLDDKQTLDLMTLAQKKLGSKGFLLTLDPLFEPEQSALASYIISKDRGTAVRTEPEYLALASKVYPNVELFVDRNPLRIPYTGIVMKCSLA
jgi:SAM-dependent methyltransferase